MLKNSINSVYKTQFPHFYRVTTLVLSVTCQYPSAMPPANLFRIRST
jgi:hypothetical protein